MRALRELPAACRCLPRIRPSFRVSHLSRMLATLHNGHAALMELGAARRWHGGVIVSEGATFHMSAVSTNDVWEHLEALQWTTRNVVIS